jgi:hypothetical protein
MRTEDLEHLVTHDYNARADKNLMSYEQCELGRRMSYLLLSYRTRLFLLATLSVVPAAMGNTQYFFNRADFPTGNQPSGVAVSDVNGDGRPDLIVTNRGDSTVSILLGQADGTFGSKMDIATGAGPTNLVVGDFNKDGNVDLATVNVGGSVSVLLGNGDGTFKPHVEYATGTGPYGIAIGDFNGDGKLDLAVVDTCGQNCGFVSVFLGNGDGTFQAKADYPVGNNPSQVVAADLNGDGKVDLAVTNESNTISILLGKGDGTFQSHVEYASSSMPFGIAAADFDGDKTPDLIVTHIGAPWGITLLKGNGDGTFQAEQQIPVSLPGVLDSLAVVALDLNGDGKQDLVLTNPGSGGVVILLGNGDGTFKPLVGYTTGIQPLALVAQDVNGDGHKDLVVADVEANYVTVLLGNGDGTFSPRTDVPPVPSGSVPLGVAATLIGDFNDDAIPDLVVSESNVNNQGFSGISVLLGKGKGQFQTPISINTISTGGNPNYMAAADFNGDGKQDLAIATGSGAAVMPGNGDGTFGAPVQALGGLIGGVRGIVAGDFNHDGKQDLVVLGNGFFGSNPIFLVLGNGDGTFQAAKQSGGANVFAEIAVGDFNHDGKLDLVVTRNPNGIAVLLGNGDGTFQNPVIYPTDELPNGVTVADVNGDGLADIIATGNKVDVFLGRGDGTFPNRVDYNGGNAPSQVITGDFNGDGKVDLAVAAEGTGATGDLEILFGKGDGTFHAPIEITDGDPLGPQLTVGDLNQDGTVDVVVAGNNGSLFLSQPIATVGPNPLNFGSEGIGSTSVSQNVTLANSGNAPLEIGSVIVSGNFAVANACGNSVASLSTCALGVTFTPATTGETFGGLTISDNARGSAQHVALSGNGVADFSLSVAAGSSNSATVTAGSPASYNLTLAPIGGFNQSVSLSCTGAPAEATCMVSPGSLALDGTNSTALSVQVTTTARASTFGIPTAMGYDRKLRVPLFGTFGALLLAWLAWWRSGQNKRISARALAVGLVLAVVFSASSCGGGSSAASPPPPPPGTPAGTFTLTVTGTANSGGVALQHNLKLTVVVN